MTQGHVVSLETSKKLKALGFPQETEFIWALGKHWKCWHRSSLPKTAAFKTAAPLLSEIIDELQSVEPTANVEMGQTVDGDLFASLVDWTTDNRHSEESNSHAEAAAKVWIWLKERK